MYESNKKNMEVSVVILYAILSYYKNYKCKNQLLKI